MGWQEPCRFVVMRIPKEQKADKPVQQEFLEEDRYTYRIFCTDKAGPAHKVTAEYDKRADVENLVGVAKREGLEAIPTGKFKSNYAFFQLVMLAYNIWRYMKLLAVQSETVSDSTEAISSSMKGIGVNTLRLARLKMLLIAAKVVMDQNRTKVKYSIHDARTPAMLNFLNFLDEARHKPKAWMEDGGWQQNFVIA